MSLLQSPDSLCDVEGGGGGGRGVPMVNQRLPGSGPLVSRALWGTGFISFLFASGTLCYLSY